MSSDDRFSWNYKPKAQQLEPVTLAPPLWTLRKDAQKASAHVKAIDGIGLELRFMIDGELRHSHLPRLAIAGEGGAGEARRVRRERLAMKVEAIMGFDDADASLKSCRLCGKTKQLRKSHIIPRFLFRWLKAAAAMALDTARWNTFETH